VVGGGDDLTSAETYDPATEKWTTTGHTWHPRWLAAMTILPTEKVLLAHGLQQLNSGIAELYHSKIREWVPTSVPIYPRNNGPTATLLQNGKVLIAGGLSYGGYAKIAEVYDPITQSWAPTGAMIEGRYGHTATLLPTGEVLVFGGAGEFRNSTEPNPTAELYDPTRGTWRNVNGPFQNWYHHTATLLRNGKVLACGGTLTSALGETTSAELYDVTTENWYATGALHQKRRSHTATLLPDGRVLVVGGVQLEPFTSLRSAELYNPNTQSWSLAQDPIYPRADHTATLLPNGKVVVAGGTANGWDAKTRSVSAEIFDPSTGIWMATGSLNMPRSAHISALVAVTDISPPVHP